MASSQSDHRQPSRGKQNAGGIHRARKGPVSPEVRREILRLVASGKMAIDVAKAFGIHNTTISRWKAEEKARRTSASQPVPAPSQADAKAPAQETGR